MCYTPTTSVTTRPVAVIFPQNSATPTSAAENEVNTTQALQPQSSSVYIQAAHRTLSSPGENSNLVISIAFFSASTLHELFPGLVCTPSSLPSTNAPTLSTYTLPGGASYFYEAPSGYQLATDAPLVARPLSPDTPLVSSEGPLIARPYTPGSGAFVSQTSSVAGGIRSTALPTHGGWRGRFSRNIALHSELIFWIVAGLIATSQPMRFNPVMIVDPSSVSVQPTFTSENSTLMISDSSLTSVSKLTSSPRPSILRKRDNEA